MGPVIRRLLACAIVLPLILCRTNGAAAQGADQCFICHQGMGDKPSSSFAHDIHRSNGVTCAGCHGGNAESDDMDRAMDPKAGFLGAPHGDEISLRCAKCHAAQFSNFQGSVHGILSTTGRERVAQCTTCHNAHGIVAVRNPASPVYPLNVVKTCTRCHNDAAYIRTYNPSLPVDQLEKYRTSVHGIRNARGDTKTAECASCHGSHDILPVTDVKSRVYPTNIPATCAACHSNAGYMAGYGIPTNQYALYAGSVHGIALLQKHDLGAPACNKCHGNHGAAPPGVESISKVCGTCHALNADLFSSSPHKKAFDDRKLPECETCHSNHGIGPANIAMLGTGPGAVCGRCHRADQDPPGYQAATAMRAMMDSLQQAEDSARALVDAAEQRGMEVGEAKFKLRDVRQARLEARTVVHAFDEERFRGVVDKGLSTASLVSAEAQGAIDEYVFRRIGLGVATLIITIVALSLYLTIRRLERRQLLHGDRSHHS